MKFDRAVIDKLKEEGNQHFKSQNYVAAAESYSSALEFTEWPQDQAELRAILLTNRATCGLQKQNIEADKIEEDLKMAQMLMPTYAKSFYRSAQLQEKLGNVEKAFTETKELLRLEPTNKTAQKEAQRLVELLKKKQDETLRSTNVHGLLAALKDKNGEVNKMEEAAVKLFLSTKETPEQTNSAVLNGGIHILMNLFEFKDFKDEEKTKRNKIRVGALKVLQFVSLNQGQKFREKFSTDDVQSLLRELQSNEKDEDVDKPLINILTNWVIAGPSTDPMKTQVLTSFFAFISSTTQKERVHMVTFVVNDILKFPWNRQDVDQVISKHLRELLYFSDVTEFRQLNSVLISRMIGVINEEVGAKFKIAYADIVTKLLKQRDDISANIKGLGALTSVMLADADIGTEILLTEVQHVVECLEFLSVKGEENSEKSLEEKFELAKSLASEILAHASGNKKFQKVRILQCCRWTRKSSKFSLCTPDELKLSYFYESKQNNQDRNPHNNYFKNIIT